MELRAKLATDLRRFSRIDLATQEKIKLKVGRLRSELGRVYWFVTPPPSPVDLWNQELRPKSRNNLWGSVTYGQNLEPQVLSLARLPLIFISHGAAVAKNDRFSELCARSDVTTFGVMPVENFGLLLRGFTRMHADFELGLDSDPQDLRVSAVKKFVVAH